MSSRLQKTFSDNVQEILLFCEYTHRVEKIITRKTKIYNKKYVK